MMGPVAVAASQRECLRWAFAAGLNVAAITKRVVDNARANFVADPAHAIAVLDWLNFDVSHRAEALLQGNAVVRLCMGSRSRFS